MIWLKKWLLMWMIAWLPVSGAMAAVMPLARSASPASAAAGGQELVALMPCHDPAAQNRVVFGEGCNHCVLCHLAGALTLGTLPVLPMIPPSHVFSAVPIAAHPSFVPELLIPPPRRALA